MRKISKDRQIFIDRVKFLLKTDIRELNSDDKVNAILIRLMTTQEEYSLLKLWCEHKFNVEMTARSLHSCKSKVEPSISKIITELKPFLWNKENNPFITDKDRRLKWYKEKPWLGEYVLDNFLNVNLLY